MRRINTFVYEEAIAIGLKPPALPVYMEEHFAQCAEDLIIASLLKAWCFNNNIDSSALKYCEIGGNHPIATSATYLLYKLFGMTGVIVEANPHLIADLKRTRTGDKIVHAAITTEVADKVILTIANASELSSLDKTFVMGWPSEGGGVCEEVEVPALRINELLEREFAGNAPVYLSIDIEGMDLSVLEDLSFDRFRPLLIQVEPSDHHIENNSSNICAYLNEQGYYLLARTEVNMIYVDFLAQAKLIHSEMLSLEASPIARVMALEQENVSIEKQRAQLEAHTEALEAQMKGLETRMQNLEARAREAEITARKALAELSISKGKLEEAKILYPERFS